MYLLALKLGYGNKGITSRNMPIRPMDSADDLHLCLYKNIFSNDTAHMKFHTRQDIFMV